MTRNKITVMFVVLLVMIPVLTSACGTIASVPEALMTDTPEQLVVEDGAAVAVVATDTALPEPTATATIPPTNTLETTVEITEELPTEVAAVASPTPDQFTILAQFGDPARGETLFFQEFETIQGSYACYTCHNVENELTKIGPGQYNIRDRAAERVPGQSAAQYIYISIVEPDDYIVPGFEGAAVAMPSNYDELLSDTQIYDLVAYLLTLHD